MSALDAQTVRSLARTLYDEEPGLAGWLARNRPAICPFELLVPHVPADASVLDVGCGGGLFLGLLALTGRLRRGVGVDPDARAIQRADRMRARLEHMHPTPPRTGARVEVRFATLGPDDALPAGPFDAVSMIDVLHHVPPRAQRASIDEALSRVRPGGRFVYKDMGRRPAAFALANRAHDAVLARQWIHYVPIEHVADAARDAGFRVLHRADARRFVYAHELLVAERTT